MKILIHLIVAALLFTACQKKVEGCMHPRAVNFNPEADTDKDCLYYQLKLEMQHYHPALINDTLIAGNLMNDVDNVSFYLTQFPILISQMHLSYAGSDQAYISPEVIILSDPNGLAVYTEDNFFINQLSVYTTDIAGWTELGTFDSIQFYIGVPNAVRSTNPTGVSINNHPLSTTASTYMYDSINYVYQSSFLELTQPGTSPSTSNSRSFSFVDYIPIKLPYNVTITDGTHTTIRLRLNYQTLFNGISFTNDNDATIKTKIVQNFPSAFSTF